MRRRAPRPLSTALAATAEAARPPTALAGVQEVWEQVAGARLAAEATPRSEHAGTVTVVCRSAVWAGELSLLAPELLERLNAALAPAGAPPVKALRFRTRGARS